MKTNGTAALLVLALAAPAMGGCVAAAVGAVGTAGYVAAQNRSPTQVADDSATRICINDKLLKRSTSLFSNVSVEVVRGRVLLIGTVASEADRAEAESLTRTCEDVKEIDNRIEIADDGGVGGYASDSWITAKVKSNLVTDFSLNGFSIGVETVNGIVYLSGVVRSAEQRDKAVEIARSISGVQKVVSAIQVDPE
ncbi:BON domain-containing protein [Zavarzinia compransoris]|uniref:BON domain-containing protein n=1 Tax=Zavarzinia marina TaxID=2911065 RepID=UPI001F39C83F|nr:BON domain-containing protein [Zavarzinia marina]MCF4165309.1 BON domain-containing protein [Zavarzinia marina]